MALEQLKTLANVPMKKIRPCLLWIRLVLMKKCSDMPDWLSSTLDASNYTALGEVLKVRALSCALICYINDAML